MSTIRGWYAILKRPSDPVYPPFGREFPVIETIGVRARQAQVILDTDLGTRAHGLDSNARWAGPQVWKC